MSDTFLSALVAAGGNSRAARSARAKLQWRDRYGRWIEMGRGVKFKVRGADGAPRSVIGSFVGALDAETGQVYVSQDPNGLPDGFYDVKSANAQEFVANLDQTQLAERGIVLGKDATGQAVGERIAEVIPNINEMQGKDAPEGWIAQPGTFGGKKVIETDDGDFRVHFGGKDQTVLLEDHRAAPGQAEPQRSVAEAFKKVGDVDIQREESGDSAYSGLAADNDAKLASRDRDSKIEQIKGNERTLMNERAPLGAKQTAMTANETLKKELEDEGQPYDPEGNDSDEALAARKGAPAEAAPDATAAPTAGTGDIDLSTFEVAPEGFLIPTGKQTNDISPAGLASFMTAEKEQLSRGGARLVVDTDAGSAEIYNSADTLEDAQAQAGGIGVPQVLDLSTGQAVDVGAPNPNAGDPNVDLSGDTVNAPNSNPDAVERGTAQPGSDAPVGDQPNPEAGGPAAGGSPDPSSGPAGDPAAPGVGPAIPDARAATTSPSNTPGSVEELKERRAQVQAALETAGDPKDIVALNEQADALDNRIRREELGAAFKGEPRNGEPGARVIRDGESEPDAPEAEAPARKLSLPPDGHDRVLENGGLTVSAVTGEEPTDGFMVAIQGHNMEIPEDVFADPVEGPKATQAWIDENAEMLSQPGAHIGVWHDVENKEVVLDVSERVESREEAIALGQERNQQAVWDVASGEEIATGGTGDRAGADVDVEAGIASLLDQLEEAFNKTDPFSDSNSERRERSALRVLRDAERNGDIEKGKSRLSQAEKDALTDEIAQRLGLREAPAPAPEPEPEAPEAPETPQDAPEAPETAPEPVEAPQEAPAAPEPAPELPAYVEPGDIEAVSAARAELDAIDAEIDNELSMAEATENDPMEQVGHLSRVRTLERQRKVYQNALDRALGNAPMDLNKDLGWSLRDKENRGALPEVPAAEPDVEEIPDADTPAVLDDEITPDAAPDLKDIGPDSLRVGDYIQHPETGNVVRITNIESERYPEEGDSKFTIDFESRDPIEEGENESAGTIELWGQDRVDTFKGWRERPTPDPEPVRTTEGNRRDAEIARDKAETDYLEVLMKDDYTDEEYDAALEARDRARADLYAFDDLDADPGDIEVPDTAPAPEPVLEPAPEPVEVPVIDAPVLDPEPVSSAATEVNRELADRAAVEERIDPADGVGGLYEGDDDPYNPAPGHDNRVASLKAKMQGKDIEDQERAQIEAALSSDALSDSQLNRIAAEVSARPNRANTTTISRPDEEQPEYLSTADLEIVDAERSDPSYVFDEDLTWRKVREEFPNATELDNGDLILDTATNKGKRYDTMLRRTRKNRFLVYVQETDQSGNRRAKRIGNTEWHSYEALEKRITAARKLIASSSPAGSLARRKDQPTENLGTQGFLADDFIGDLGNPDAPIPTTGDEKFDRLLEVAAMHIRNEDADLSQIEAHLEDMDPGANAINTIMQAIIGRAQDMYRPDGVAPWQTYDGVTAEIGQEYDWTDWHQELNWWLPDGTLNPNRIANPTHGEVHRVRVTGYIKENTDGKATGKGHTYGDHVWVQVQQPDGSWSNWTKRSAQTLRQAEPGSAPGLPFFSKREEWRTNPEALARRFRVPTAAPEEPVQTKPRPKGDLPSGRRVRFTSRGTLPGYSNVPVPTSQPEIAGMLASGEIRPQVREASEVRPGMMLVRMGDDGKQYADAVIRVENLGDGGYRIHTARPDGNGFADIDTIVIPGDAEIVMWTSPNIRPRRTPSEEPRNATRGELVSFDRNGETAQGIVVFDDGQGNAVVNTDSGDTVDILKSHLTTVPDPEVSTEDRQDLVDALDDHDIPQYIKDLILQGVLSPGLSLDRYRQLIDIAESFATRTGQIRQVDQILDMIGATDQQRADVHAIFTAPGQD